MKNPPNYGSISKLSGNRRKPYIVRLTSGYEIDEITQKAVQKRTVLGYYATRSEAMQALAEFNRNPLNLDTMKATFRDCYEAVLPEFSTSRKHNYISAFRYLENVADLPIRSIKLFQLQKCIDACQTTQQREIKTVCRKVYEYALKNEIVDRNPAEFLKSNNVAATITREVFTSEQIDELWNREEYFAKITLMLLYTGMRTKELQDLEPDDINLEEKYINIRIAKNNSSVRKVPIHDRVFDLFSEFKSDSRTFTHNGLNKWLKSNYTHYAHDCRHTFASRMREIGTDLLVLQLILGHTPQTITEKIYTHIPLSELSDAINHLYY